MSQWQFDLHGGAYDGWYGTFLQDADPPQVLLVWECPDDPRCPGHATVNADREDINLRTVEAYELVAVDIDNRQADYTLGQGTGDGDEQDARELVGAGAFARGGSFTVPPGHVWPWEVNKP